MGIRAIVIPGGVLREHLWRFLSDPIDAAKDWLDWVGVHHRLPAKLADPIAATIRAAPECATISELYPRLRVSPRTLSNQLKINQLPKLERWFNGARLLDAQLRLQRDASLKIWEVAEEFGYEDELSFSNRVYRLFGLTAKTSRRLLGLEWRFHEWWTRSHRLPPDA